MNSQTGSSICFFAEPNFLSVNILEILLSNNCFVTIASDKKDKWIEKTKNISLINRFSVISVNDLSKAFSYDYLIYCDGFINSNTENSLPYFINLTNKYDKKSLAILPRHLYKNTTDLFSDQKQNVGIIYAGDVFGPRFDLDSDLEFSQLIKEIFYDKKVKVSIGEKFFPVFVSDAAKQIVKWIFSFGPFGKETFLLGPETSPEEIWRESNHYLGNINYETDSTNWINNLPKNIDAFYLSTNLRFCLGETYRWLSKIVYKRNSSKKLAIKKICVNVNKKYVNKIIVGLLITLLSPFFFILIGSGLDYLSFMLLKSGNDSIANVLLGVGKTTGDIGYIESSVMKFIPLFGKIYLEGEYVSYTLTSISSIGKSAIPLIEDGEKTISSIFNNSQSQISETAGKDTKNISDIYNIISEFEKKTFVYKDQGVLSAKYIISKVDIETYKNLSYQLVSIVKRFPEILGSNGKKTYLVLFQNNMELRPTGGFIGSYGLLTFDNGNLSDFSISDIYSADGQLNGHVEPPLPIKNYLGEANWWFRDSNWDPDFPTSAKRAEWFLDKEVNKQVDGVVAIDLNLVKDFLKNNGPIHLTDYELDISDQNIYEKIQSEVQDNFFPGTYTKASYLTALAKSILLELKDLKSSKNLAIIKEVYSNLTERHIQIYIHDSDFQKAISNLNWDGSVFIPECGDNCLSDLTGTIEANVGVNKSNYFISRSSSLDIKINSRQIDKVYTLSINNSAPTTLGPSGIYKSYIRLLVPQNATRIRAEEILGKDIKDLPIDMVDAKGRKEVGVYTEILGGEKKQIVYSWTEPMDIFSSQYGFYLRKQAGIESYPLTINLNTPVGIVDSNKEFSLTNTGKYVYNTTLVKDLYLKFSL